MVFATDLDNTIIYSHKIIKKNDPNFTCVEYIDDKPITYMQNTAIEKLELIMKKITVVPVTTRSLTQFSRISIFKNCKYSIVANGGIILIDGIADLEYLKTRNDLLSNYDFKYPMKVVETLPGLELSPRLVDTAFIFAKVRYPEQCEIILRRKLDTKKWQIDSIGNKIYVIPAVINKGSALKYLVDVILKNTDSVIAVGDSKLDIPMLEYSNYPLIPFGCKLQSENLDVLTVGKNIFASDDILSLILNLK